MLYSIMLRAGVLFLLIVAAAAAAKKHPKFAKLITESEDKKDHVKDLLTELGTGDVLAHHSKPFPYNDPSLYTDSEALKNFTTYWEEGFLAKDGVFNPSCKQIGRHVDSLFKLFNATIDFDTFYEVAVWAKEEVHPEMFVYAVMNTVMEREDPDKVPLPALYEVLPTYFVPSTVSHQVLTAYLNGVDSRRYQNNNTGWEWSWHHSDSMLSPYVVRQTDKRSYDVESRLSYFREDYRRLDYIYKRSLFYGFITPNIMKNESAIDRFGELRYILLRWLLSRYNFERYAVGLSPVQPINLRQPIMPGYDPNIIGLNGHPIPGRPNNVIPLEVNPEGVATVEKIVRRVQDIVNAGVYRNRTGYLKHVEGIEALNVLGNKLIAGDNSYYPSLYFNLLSLVDGLVTTSNGVGYGTGTLLNAMTMARDPVYYQILAYINRFFTTLEDRQQPYTKEELGFPGVTITDVKASKLQTYFEYGTFSIKNLVPDVKVSDYKASQFRINHIPFSIKMKVNSKVQTNAMIKIFLGPAYDARNETLSINDFRKSLIMYLWWPVTLKEGENKFEKKILDEALGDQSRANDIRRWCHYPINIILPKGSENGLPIKMYVVVYPFNGQTELKKHCVNQHLTSDYEHTIRFPIDRHWTMSTINQTNHKIIDTFIYHSDTQIISKQKKIRG